MKNSFHLWSQAESFFLLFNEEVFFSGNCLCVLWKFTIIISVHRMDSFPKGHKVGKPMYPSAIICTTFDCLQSIFTTICHRTQFILSKSFSRNSALLENMSTSVPSKLKPLNCGSHQKMITVVLGYFFNHSSFWECIFHLHCWIFSICVCVCVRCHSSWSLRCMFFTISKSEREKQISFSNTCIWNLERWYWWAYVQGRNRDTDIENRLVDTVWGREGSTSWERSMETDTLLHMKQIARGALLYNTGSSTWCSVTTSRSGMGLGGRIEREGTSVYLWLIHIHVWQGPTQHCKAIILQLKIIFFKKMHFFSHFMSLNSGYICLSPVY